MKYTAKYNKIWQNTKTGKTGGRDLLLGEGETLADYRQIPLKKDAAKAVATKDAVKGEKQ